MKRIASAILAAFLLAMYFPAFQGMAATSGNWTYEVSGSESIITKYGGTEAIVEIPETLGEFPVVGIQSQAFYGKTTITQVTIPSTVKSIGSRAFYACSKLTTINLPEGLTTIEDYAFASCSALNSIVIPSTVSAIKTQTFYGCKALTTVTFQTGDTSGYKSIGESAFNACTSLKTVILPSTLSYIATEAFSGCTSLESLHLPKSLGSIASSSFANCASLESITVDQENNSFVAEDNVLYNKNKTTIILAAAKAQWENGQLAIPDTITTINANAFSSCSNLVSVTMNDNVKNIDTNAFSKCTALESITLPPSLTSIKSATFSGCTALKTLEIPSGVKSIDTSAFTNCTSLESINIPAGITTIASSTFYSCKSLTSIEIPDSVTSIQSSAFNGCTGLTSISIPNSVAVINSSAFQNCTSMETVQLSNQMKMIYDSTFRNCTMLKTISIPESVTSIGNYAFSASGLEEIYIPSNVTSIGTYVFDACANLERATIGLVGTISDYIFRNCKNLTDITILEGVTSISKYAFESCTGLLSLEIPGNVKTINNYAFSKCQNLETVNILSGVTTIGESVFNECKALSSISIPDSVTAIGNGAFYLCSSLETISLPKMITSISSNTFVQSGLVSIVLPENVVSINSNAFGNCASLTDITLPKSLKTINPHAFNGAGMETITIPNSVTGIYEYAFKNCTNLKKINLSENMTTLATELFASCTSLAEIVLPKGIKTITSGAFKGCNKLTTVMFLNPETTITSSSFSGGPNITTIYGYSVSTAATYYKNKNFIPIDEPVTLFLKKDSAPLEGITISDEFGESAKTNENGEVRLPVENFNIEDTHNYIINFENITYRYALQGAQIAFLNFKPARIKVLYNDAIATGATVRISDQSKQQTVDENGIAEFLVFDSGQTLAITVEYNDSVGQLEVTSGDIGVDGLLVIDIASKANPTISGKATHNSNGISGVVLTAQKAGGNLLYARTKADGSYRFILPHNETGSYSLDVIDEGGYDEGILANTHQTAQVGDRNVDFVFNDGYKISGVVTNTKGQPLPESEFLPSGELAPTVKLYLEKDNEIWTTETTDGGAYEFKALAPGQYKLSYGITNYVYESDEIITLNQNMTKNITVANYSVTNPRNISYSISVKSPVEHGEMGVVSVRCANLDNKKYNNLILEVEIPQGVVVNTASLENGLTYEDGKVIAQVNLGVAGAFMGADIFNFSFMYSLENGYDKNKVVFTAFAREEGATATAPIKEFEMPHLDWERTDENKTLGRNTNSWKWSDLAGLSLDIDDTTKIWDGQHQRYFSNYGTGAETSKDYATWTYRPSKGSHEYRRFKSSFTKPDESYVFSHILSENYAAYAGRGAVFPVNDEIFIFVYPQGTTVTDQNASQFLAFWGSTQFHKYSNGKFMGVQGNKAIQYNGITAFKHSDYWVMDGTINRVSEILNNFPSEKDFVIDVFASDVAEGGGIDKFSLMFTNSEIPPLDGNNKTMPYIDFIGSAHADVFKPTLTGDECLSVEYVSSNEYKLSGQSMKNSDVEIFRLDTNGKVAEFHAEGFYSDIGTLLPPVAGTYPFVAKCTKGESTLNSNIHVVEVLGGLELTNLRLTSATLKKIRQVSHDPFISINVPVGAVVDVGTTFNNELRPDDKVFYKLSSSKRAFNADINSNHTAVFPPIGTGTTTVSVVVVRDDNVIFHKNIGRIYAAIDPSGYVYDSHTQKRIEDAQVTCYILDGGEWKFWQAQNHGQANPLITDENGRYAWDVPEGVYKVTVSKEGYADYDTINDVNYTFEVGETSSIVIPPPRLDINMGLENISKPEIIEAFPNNQAVVSPNDIFSYEFNKSLDIDTLTGESIVLEGEGGITKDIDISVNSTQNIISIVPKQSLEEGEYTITFSNSIQDFMYTQTQNIDQVSFNFSVSAQAETTKEAFQIVSYTPTINVNDPIIVTFNQSINELNPENICLRAADLEVVPASLALSADKTALIVLPENPLTPATAYGLVLGAGIESVQGLGLQEETISISTLDKVKAPYATPLSGIIEKGEAITLACDTDGAIIRYTLDGSVPNQSSTLYTQPLMLSASGVINAIAFKDGWTGSDVAMFEYIVGAGQPAPESGRMIAVQNIGGTQSVSVSNIIVDEGSMVVNFEKLIPGTLIMVAICDDKGEFKEVVQSHIIGEEEVNETSFTLTLPPNLHLSKEPKAFIWSADLQPYIKAVGLYED